jgi:CRISPR-associated endonuclease/helicase Cas3
VSRRAEEFAAGWNGGAWAANAGLWHDLGKFSSAVQRYLARGGDGPKVDHSTAGGIHAIKRAGAMGRILAYVIVGHHTGLPDATVAEGEAALDSRLNRTNLYDDALAGGPDEHILAGYPMSPLKPGTDIPFFTRMIFSTLIDADRLDTEAFMSAETAAQRTTPIPINTLRDRLDGYLAAKMREAAPTRINALRKRLLDDCLAAAHKPRGLFSLTGPLGLGKTLSGLAFALAHAEEYGMARVIYVAPFTSIIEQTAEAFREALGDDTVVEHHSNLDPENEGTAKPWHRAATENWDASLIVTTAVQFFESLYSAKGSRCRKLHRITNAVIVLDEAHLVPTEYLAPIMRALNELMKLYGSTVVLVSATQPALDPLPEREFTGLYGPNGRTEIVREPEVLRDETRRFEVELPSDFYKPATWTEMSNELAYYPSVLCVVSSRRDAFDLHQLMPEGTYHLSGLMCGQHISEIIREIKARLMRGEPTRLIATQLVETGVGFDFPVVFRAMAGLDSLGQSGGRCNREGNSALGTLVVFIPPEKPKIPFLRTCYELTETLLRQEGGDPFSTEMFRKYFERLYWLKADQLDHHGINALLPADPREALQGMSFRTASERFKIIRDGSVPVVVPWGPEGEKTVSLLTEYGEAAPRWLLRKTQRYVVGITEKQCSDLSDQNIVHEIREGLWTTKTGYDTIAGLKVF